jgi:Domain of unknown function (DUF4157)
MPGQGQPFPDLPPSGHAAPGEAPPGQPAAGQLPAGQPTAGHDTAAAELLSRIFPGQPMSPGALLGAAMLAGEIPDGAMPGLSVPDPPVPGQPPADGETTGQQPLIHRSPVVSPAFDHEPAPEEITRTVDGNRADAIRVDNSGDHEVGTAPRPSAQDDQGGDGPDPGETPFTAQPLVHHVTADLLERLARSSGDLEAAADTRATGDRAAAPLMFHGRPAPSRVQADVRVPASVSSRVGRIHSVDVSDALVRRGPAVSARAQELGARGFTQGGVVHLPDAAGSLEDRDAAALLAHELTHVAQQRRFGSALPSPESLAGRALEAEAQAVEHWYADGHTDTPPELGTVTESWTAPERLVPALHLPTRAAATAHPARPAGHTAPSQPALQLAPGRWSMSEIGSTLSDFASSQSERVSERISEAWSGARESVAETAAETGSHISDLVSQGRARLSGAIDEISAGIRGGFGDPQSPSQPTASAEPPPLPEPTPPGLTAQEVLDLLAEDPPYRWMDMDSSQDLDELALRLYDRIVTRLRFDVLVQRERSGTLLDFG